MYTQNIYELTKQNKSFRKVLHTGSYSQLVVMNLPAKTDIGEEVHPDTDQILYIVEGEGEALIDGETRNVGAHDIVFVHSGASHNLTNSGEDDLKLFTVYAPPEHADQTEHSTKEEAIRSEEGEN